MPKPKKVMRRKKKKIPSKKNPVNRKQLELIRNIITLIVGPDASDIVNILYGKENVNEFNIAKKLNITINQARNILYKLADEGLVSFIRKKDKKNGGWYTYFWTLDIRKSLLALQQKISREIEELENQLKSKKTKRFYYCTNCGMEITEENALLHNFTCPECGEVFELKDNLETIESLEKGILKLRDNLVLVEAEIVKIQEKEEIAKIRRLKNEERKKKLEREEKRRLRELEKKKLARKGKKPKKTVKKKIGKKLRKKILKINRIIKKNAKKKKKRK